MRYLKIGLLAILPITGLVNAQSVKNNNQTKNKEVSMSVAERNKNIVREIYEESFNKRNLELLKSFIANDFVGIKGAQGAEGFQESALALIKAFPNVQWNLVTLIAEGDEVFVKWKLVGTHEDTFQNIKATGKEVSTDGMAIYKFKDGKVVSTQIHTDRLGFLQQLEVLPVDLTSVSIRKSTKDYVRFIDTFVIPESVRHEFMERVKINRDFIKTLPGFVEDAAFERKDENGKVIFMTIAVWENAQAIQHAKEAVQAEYKREGFDPAALLKRLNITMERGVFSEAVDQ